MTKTYFNSAIIGNSRVLGCLTDRGELVRLFWPNIDYPQHIDKLLAGVFNAENEDGTLWLNEDNFEPRQEYIEDTNIIKTIYSGKYSPIKVTQTDYVLPYKDIVIRQYEVINEGEYEMNPGFMIYSSCITTTSQLRSTIFDFELDAVIHYMHGYYISISANREVYQFQLGNNAYESARHGVLSGYDSIGMMPDAAVSWKLGSLQPGERKLITVHICVSNTLKGVKELVKYIKGCDESMEYLSVRKFWKDYLNSAIKIHTGRADIDMLYKRSLLVFSLMADAESGGLLAAPEIDEEFTRCGRYAYCWGRDAAFITGALDRCGLSAIVDKFYDWAVQAQDIEGYWHQRYHMDGNLAPSWGLQIDETGTVIWGMLEHYRITGSKNFLERMWGSVERGVKFLIRFIDSETGLPGPSYDLWEERVGEHAYSSAAVCAGIRAGAEIADILEKDKAIADAWRRIGISIKNAIENNLWQKERGRFLRSIRVKLNPWGSENNPDTIVIEVNPKGYRRDVTLEDATADTSLLGLAVPFNVFDTGDHKIESTAEAIERILITPVVGGIKRYENDNYIGGNPWIITTLWVALYHVRKKNYDRALSYLEWAVKSSTALDLLPEQVDRNTGGPAWVIPLTWSHAMFVLVLMELTDAGAI